ncbi:hypothetical protein SAMD00019534_050450, partial [Acytostelium subglobosum LB1]|uniref:hypothetical protein n=1 Tax=Acytostelium subglobosum LB1 TaxID=1410327 RepID=UPI000644DF3C
MSDISITLDALIKIHSHSFKYCTHAVNGVLLGKVAKSSLTITDVIPLFHSMTLTPMFEVAMIQIEEYCNINQIDMIGYYHANENTHDKEMEPISKKVADRLYNELSSMCFISITEITQDNQLGLIPIGRATDGQWVKNEDKQLKLTDSDAGTTPKQAIQAVVKAGKERLFNDFEDYLNNPTLDWLNK